MVTAETMVVCQFNILISVWEIPHFVSLYNSFGWFPSLQDGFKMFKNHYPDGLGEGACPPPSWPGWKPLAMAAMGKEAFHAIENPIFRFRCALSLTLETVKEVGLGKNVDLQAVEDKITAMYLAENLDEISPRLQLEDYIIPIITERKTKKKRNKTRKKYYLVVQDKDDEQGEWFSGADLKNQFPYVWTIMLENYEKWVKQKESTLRQCVPDVTVGPTEVSIHEKADVQNNHKAYDAGEVRKAGFVSPADEIAEKVGLDEKIEKSLQPSDDKQKSDELLNAPLSRHAKEHSEIGSARKQTGKQPHKLDNERDARHSNNTLNRATSTPTSKHHKQDHSNSQRYQNRKECWIDGQAVVRGADVFESATVHMSHQFHEKGMYQPIENGYTARKEYGNGFQQNDFWHIRDENFKTPLKRKSHALMGHGHPMEHNSIGMYRINKSPMEEISLILNNLSKGDASYPEKYFCELNKVSLPSDRKVVMRKRLSRSQASKGRHQRKPPIFPTDIAKKMFKINPRQQMPILARDTFGEYWDLRVCLESNHQYLIRGLKERFFHSHCIRENDELALTIDKEGHWYVEVNPPQSLEYHTPFEYSPSQSRLNQLGDGTDLLGRPNWEDNIDAVDRNKVHVDSEGAEPCENTDAQEQMNSQVQTTQGESSPVAPTVIIAPVVRDPTEEHLTQEMWNELNGRIVGAKTQEDGSVHVWVEWSDGYKVSVPSVELRGKGKEHLMESLIQFYESKTRKKRKKQD